jgi:hypothetical protein
VRLTLRILAEQHHLLEQINVKAPGLYYAILVVFCVVTIGIGMAVPQV